MPSSLVDRFGRTIDYLRISLTDQCNFRCTYCMPPEGIATLSREDYLPFDDITRIVRLFVGMGGKKVRLTGGEPFMRKGIETLVEQLTRLAPRPSVYVTTNGSLLAGHIALLARAGIDGINISLDSLDAQRFANITGQNKFEEVLAGIDAALAFDLPVKINVVAMSTLTDDELIAFGMLAKRLPIEVRFIEFMPLCGTGWHPEWMLPMRTLKEKLSRHFTFLPDEEERAVAEVYTIEGGEGRVGFIASMTEPFCHNCTRLRLTADGKLRPCLFSETEVDLRALLRSNATDHELMQAIQTAVVLKPAGHGITPLTCKPETMPRIRFVGG